MEILRCERGQGQGTPFGGKCLFNPDTFRTRAGLRCADLPWRARHVVFLLEMFRMVGAWSRLAFPDGSGLGICAPSGCSALRASPADVSRHIDQGEAQTFPDKHHQPSARLHPALIWSDSCWASQQAVPRLDDVFYTSVTLRQVRPLWWWWWWMSVNFLSSSSLPTLTALNNLVLCLTVRCVLFLTCFYITKK